MKIHNRVIYPIIIIFLISGCDLLDSSGEYGTNIIYPLENGNQWIYNQEFGLYNFRSFDNPDSVIDRDEYHYAEIEVRSNGIVTLNEFEHNSSPVSELEQTAYIENGQPQMFRDWRYYTNTENGLFLLGSRFPSGVTATPKYDIMSERPGNAFHILFDGKYFTTVGAITEYVEYAVNKHYTNADSIYVEKYPVKVIPKRMRPGKQWTARTAGNPWRVDKRIVAKEMIEIPAGRFECYKVQWYIDLGDTGEWNDNLIYYDYFGQEGLIKREFYFKDLIWMSIESSDPEGYFDSHDIKVLTEFDVN